MNQKKDFFTSKEDKWDYIIALIVIVLFSIFIYYLSFSTKGEVVINTPTELQEVEVEPTKSNTEKDKYLYTNSNTYQTETIKVEDDYESEKDSAIIISDIPKAIMPVKNRESKSIVNNEIREYKSIVDNEIKESIETDNEIIPPTEMVLDVEEPVTSVKEPVIELKTLQEVAKPMPVEVQVDSEQKTNLVTFNCVIVVGVFREPKNKLAIIEQLQKLGYAQKEGVLRNDLNYVGVPINCSNKKENLKLLNELNEALGIQSWIKKIL